MPPRARAVVGLLAVPFGASAHPMGYHVAGHQLQLWVGDEVRVEYRVDVPIDARFPPPDEVRDPEQLLNGLVLSVDGKTVPWAADIEADAVHIRSRSAIVRVGGNAALPADDGRRMLRITNGNLPDVPAFFSHDVQVQSGWTVVEGSFLRIEAGAVSRDDTRAWRVGDDNRSLDMTIERVGPVTRVWQRLAPVDPWRRASATVEPGALAAWSGGAATPAVALVAAVCATSAAASSGVAMRRPGHWRAVLVDGVLLGFALLLALWSAPLVAVAAGALVCGAACWTPWRSVRTRAGLGVAASAALVVGRTGPALLLLCMTLVAWSLGRITTRNPPNRAHLAASVIATAAALAVASRAVATWTG